MTIIENQKAINGKPKILLLDDEVHTLDALERLLRSHFKIIRSADFVEGIELMKNHLDLAVVLSDHRMPRGLGTDFLMKAKSLVPNAVRAILTGQMDLQDLAHAINEISVHRLILKPWDNEFLRVQMLECLQHHHLLREKNFFEQLSITDPVTHLRNHRFFQEQLKTFIDRCQRYQYPLCLVMIDVDNFKKYNDEFGHPEGDRLLALIGQRLVSEVRSIDLVARYGGEEFTLILSDTSLEKSIEVSERLRRAFENKPFQIPGHRSVFITISLGVASLRDHGETGDELIAAADAALYQAKRQGRNRVFYKP